MGIVGIGRQGLMADDEVVHVILGYEGAAVALLGAGEVMAVHLAGDVMVDVHGVGRGLPRMMATDCS